MSASVKVVPCQSFRSTAKPKTEKLRKNAKTQYYLSGLKILTTLQNETFVHVQIPQMGIILHSDYNSYIENR